LIARKKLARQDFKPTGTLKGFYQPAVICVDLRNQSPFLITGPGQHQTAQATFTRICAFGIQPFARDKGLFFMELPFAAKSIIEFKFDNSGLRLVIYPACNGNIYLCVFF